MKSTPTEHRQNSLSRNQHGESTSAFTLIELLVVICVIALLASMLVPTLAGSRIGSESFRCQNNNRQLCSAWRMYADDNNDRIVFSADDGTPAGATYAWTKSHMDFSPGNVGNWDTNYDIVKGPLWPYTSKDASIYRCPSDHSYVVTPAGVAMPRVRSFSLNLYAGGFAGSSGGLFSTNVYRLFLKTTDFSAPGPAKTFLFIDMRPESINWGSFYTDMSGFPDTTSAYRFSGDWPGIFHNFGATVSFADGRAEIHRWVDPRTAPLLSGSVIGGPAVASPRNVDIGWLQARATSRK
jgi:prepilin-type N-terminal cleavage/methylation domain-containing protein/prepilin-type processing-associated H-X9-DG protein